MAEIQLYAPMAGTQLSSSMVQPQNSHLHGRTSTSQHHGRNSTESFFKIFQLLNQSLLGMTSSTLQPHFLSGVYYDNGDCHILCA